MNIVMLFSSPVSLINICVKYLFPPLNAKTFNSSCLHVLTGCITRLTALSLTSADFIRKGSQLPDKVKMVPSLILHILSCNPVANVCFISICQKQCPNRLCLPWVGSINPLLETVQSFHVGLRPWFSSNWTQSLSVPRQAGLLLLQLSGKYPLDKEKGKVG